MGDFIVKLDDDEYVIFSSVVEAPTSRIHTRQQAVEAWGEERIGFTDEHGASLRPSMLRPSAHGWPAVHIDQWLEGESLNQSQPWTVKRIRDEIGYVDAHMGTDPDDAAQQAQAAVDAVKRALGG
jgi:hypothetical protein